MSEVAGLIGHKRCESLETARFGTFFTRSFIFPNKHCVENNQLNSELLEELIKSVKESKAVTKLYIGGTYYQSKETKTTKEPDFETVFVKAFPTCGLFTELSLGTPLLWHEKKLIVNCGIKGPAFEAALHKDSHITSLNFSIIAMRTTFEKW